MAYEYRAIYSKTSEVTAREVRKGKAGHKIASQLEIELEELSRDGWTLSHIDTTTVVVRPGFFSRLFGASEEMINLKIYVWMREI